MDTHTNTKTDNGLTIYRKEESSFFDHRRMDGHRLTFTVVKRQWENNVYFVYYTIE